MSLRSNSPCTSTSSPIASCSATQRRVSSCEERLVGVARSICPARHAARASRTSRSAGTSRSSSSGTSGKREARALLGGARSRKATLRRSIASVRPSAVAPDGRVAGARDDARRLASARGVRLELAAARAASPARVGERADLVELLGGEREPALELGVELRLGAQVDRARAAASTTARPRRARAPSALTRAARPARAPGRGRCARCCGRRRRPSDRTVRGPISARAAAPSCSGARTRSTWSAVEAEPARQIEVRPERRRSRSRAAGAAACVERRERGAGARGRPRGRAASRSRTRHGSSSCTHATPFAARRVEQLLVDREQRVERGRASTRRRRSRSPASTRSEERHGPEEHRPRLDPERARLVDLGEELRRRRA